jgi:hypothetical protein
MTINATFLDIGSADYDHGCTGEAEWPVSVGIYPTSTVETLLTEMKWEIERSDIPDTISTADMLAALRLAAVHAADRAAFMTEGQESIAWFRIDWAG